MFYFEPSVSVVYVLFLNVKRNMIRFALGLAAVYSFFPQSMSALSPTKPEPLLTQAKLFAVFYVQLNEAYQMTVLLPMVVLMVGTSLALCFALLLLQPGS